MLNLNYGDVIMGTMASQITSLVIVYSTVYSGADQRKHLSSASLAFVQGIHRRSANSQRANYAENVSIWWRHHEPGKCYISNGTNLIAPVGCGDVLGVRAMSMALPVSSNVFSYFVFDQNDELQFQWNLTKMRIYRCWVIWNIVLYWIVM